MQYWKNQRLAKIYHAMKQRCYNVNNTGYKNYGGRGIAICDEWLESPESFQEWALNNGYTDKLTIDRINNDKGYSPDNCRWATMKQQANNKRNNHFVTYNGETHTISEWADSLGVDYKEMSKHLNTYLPLSFEELQEQHEIHYKNIAKSKKQLSNPNIKGVNMYVRKTHELIKTFDDIHEAAYYVTGDRKKTSSISNVCRGVQNKAYGFYWQYVK